ncbi:hypothetical protein [Rhodococcus sp. JS3073]|uniref:hypothetical protein n=1 Tax=Rhodococcus sp. JS3073 TaxID=3002901 RepID=UPI0022865E12|nr:hypothetical protein [Rhodococcus sp. JS3073]WAM19246.1 hypothetical protein OYT95_42775 [Rhodococcus sp. JS3073]
MSDLYGVGFRELAAARWVAFQVLDALPELLDESLSRHSKCLEYLDGGGSAEGNPDLGEADDFLCLTLAVSFLSLFLPEPSIASRSMETHLIDNYRVPVHPSGG